MRERKTVGKFGKYKLRAKIDLITVKGGERTAEATKGAVEEISSKKRKESRGSEREEAGKEGKNVELKGGKGRPGGPELWRKRTKEQVW